jgi:hypothetical protein
VSYSAARCDATTNGAGLIQESIIKRRFERSDQERISLISDKLSLPEQARQHAPAAIAELVRIVEYTKSDAARLAGIRVLLDRGFGKPPLPLDIAIRDRVKPAPPLSEEDARECYRRLRLNPWSFLDVALEVPQAGAAATPKAEGEG